jgi:hypothetical protein
VRTGPQISSPASYLQFPVHNYWKRTGANYLTIVGLKWTSNDQISMSSHFLGWAPWVRITTDIYHCRNDDISFLASNKSALRMFMFVRDCLTPVLSKLVSKFKNLITLQGNAKHLTFSHPVSFSDLLVPSRQDMEIFISYWAQPDLFQKLYQRNYIALGNFRT